MWPCMSWRNLIQEPVWGGARPKATIEHELKLWLGKFPAKDDRFNLQRVEFATLELARRCGLSVTRAQLQTVGQSDVLMLQRFDREHAGTGYLRFGLVSGLTVLDCGDSHLDRDRWPYPLLADQLRRWSDKPDTDCAELFVRMVFNAAVTNNDDHPRNHALLRSGKSWRLSPAYDLVPAPLVSLERRDLALTLGRYGRTASVYKLLFCPNVLVCQQHKPALKLTAWCRWSRIGERILKFVLWRTKTLGMWRPPCCPHVFSLKLPRRSGLEGPTLVFSRSDIFKGRWLRTEDVGPEGTDLRRPWATASIAVRLHHAFKGAFEAFAHAVAVAHDALHDAELAHVAGHEFFHTPVQALELFFVFDDLSRCAFALGIDQASRQQHFFDAVDGFARQTRWGGAVNAFVVGACREHGRHLAEIVLQSCVKFGLVQIHLAKTVQTQTHIARCPDIGSWGVGGVGDQIADLVAHRLQQAFSCQYAAKIFDLTGTVAQNFEGFLKGVVSGHQPFDVVFDARGVAIQVQPRRASGVGEQIQCDAVDHVVDGVAAAGNREAVDFETGIGGCLQWVCKADCVDGDRGRCARQVVAGQAEVL